MGRPNLRKYLLFEIFRAVCWTLKHDRDHAEREAFRVGCAEIILIFEYLCFLIEGIHAGHSLVVC